MLTPKQNIFQNIDSLERAVGVPEDILVELHGSFRSGTCIRCGLGRGPWGEAVVIVRLCLRLCVSLSLRLWVCTCVNVSVSGYPSSL